MRIGGHKIDWEPTIYIYTIIIQNTISEGQYIDNVKRRFSFPNFLTFNTYYFVFFHKNIILHRKKKLIRN